MQLVLVLYRSRAEYFIAVGKFDDDALVGVAADYAGWITFSWFPHVACDAAAST
jgi:hypothetical protein